MQKSQKTMYGKLVLCYNELMWLNGDKKMISTYQMD